MRNRGDFLLQLIYCLRTVRQTLKSFAILERAPGVPLRPHGPGPQQRPLQGAGLQTGGRRQGEDEGESTVTRAILLVLFIFRRAGRLM